MASFTWVGGADINGANNWITPANWLAGGLPAATVPNSIADDVTVNSDTGGRDAIISGGQGITVASLNIGNTTGVPGGHVLVGGSPQIGGGGGGVLVSTGAITVSSTNSGGGLVGGLASSTTAPSMTLSGPGVVIGGGGTFNIGTLVNNGEIQADGGYFGLGGLLLNSGTITGTGFIEVDGPSSVELNAPTAETIRVANSRGQTGQVFLDQPAAFTGALDVLNSNTTVDLFLKNESPAGVTFNADAHALVITGANGAVLNTIPFVSSGTVTLAVVPSTVAGYGEVTLSPSTPAIVPGIPAPVGGVSTTTLSSSDLSAVLQGDQGSMRFVTGTEAIVLVDGTLSVGPDTNQAFLTRLYYGVLGRAPDLIGFSSWNATLSSTSKASVAQAFLNTPEYQAANLGQTNASFVQSLYHGLLGRPADAAGLSFWTQSIAGGMSHGEVAATFADLAEAKQNWSGVTSTGNFAYNPNAAVVREDYKSAFGRDADTPSLTFWTNALNGGATADQVAQMLAQSPEFQALHGQQTDVQYVDSLYTAGLGRTASAPEEAGWAATLQAGASRGSVLASIAQSPESQQHLQWSLSA
jgi:hypothetical protein